MAAAPKISAILLAAGLSRRLGRNKLLLPAGGMPVVRRTALALLASGVSEVIAVTGHEEERVREALGGLALLTVHNPRHAEGQSTSLRAGLEAASEDAGGFLFVLGDQPLLTPAVVDRLIAAFAGSGGRALAAAPFFGGRRGNPVLFAASLRGELLGVEGDEGARSVLRRIADQEPDRLLRVPLEEGDAFLDLDTDADYEKILERLGGP